MEIIKVHGKKFVKSISEEDILKRVKEIAQEINENCKFKNPLFLAVLNGSFMFTSDLMKEINIECELQFVKMNSYTGMHSTAIIKTLIGPTMAVSGRTVVVIEDIAHSVNIAK